MIRSIELECDSDSARPADLITDIVKDTSLEILTETEGTVKSYCRGSYWRWKYPQVNEKHYRRDLPILKKRIMSLYKKGVIKYGSW